jgi:hypothetical protein
VATGNSVINIRGGNINGVIEVDETSNVTITDCYFNGEEHVTVSFPVLEAEQSTEE